MATLAGVVEGRLLKEVTSELGPTEEMEPHARHQGGNILAGFLEVQSLERSWFV